MILKIPAIAGTLESSDVQIAIAPNPGGGIDIDLESDVKAQFGEAIEDTVRDVLAEFGIEDASVRLLDKYGEHQLGLAVDINGATYDLYFWLQENSHKYGFIYRYPAGKTEITGVNEEVWHYRYVGVEVATEIYKQGLCLEEYLQMNNK